MIIVDQARSKPSELTSETLARISQPPNKKFFIELEMNMVENPVVYDNTTFGLDEELGYTPFMTSQLNNITFMMPSSPLIYQNRKVPPVDTLHKLQIKNYFKLSINSKKEKFCNLEDKNLACPNGTKFCSCVHMLEVNLNDVVELIFVDRGIQPGNQISFLN